MRTTDTMTISLPPAMAKELDKVRKAEHRTRSELVREALRQYIENRYPAVAPNRADLSAIKRGRSAFEAGDYVRLTDFDHQLDTAGDGTSAKRVSKTARKRPGAR